MIYAEQAYNAYEKGYIKFLKSNLDKLPLLQVVSISSDIVSGNSAKFRLRIEQIDCKTGDEYHRNLRAPSDCRQYYRADSGDIQSLNFGNDAMTLY